MIISEKQIVVIIYLMIRDDVYLLPPGPALVTFPDICITKPSDRGSTSLQGAVLIKCVENFSQLHSEPINKISNKIQIIHQTWRVLTAGASRRNIVNTLLPIVSWPGPALASGHNTTRKRVTTYHYQDSSGQ